MKLRSLRKYRFLQLLLISMIFTITEAPAQIPSKKPATFYVDQSAVTGGDGTAMHPFQKIADALTTAKLRNQSVFVNIITGSYRENLVITGNTTLRGITKPGSIGKKLAETILVGSVHNNNPITLKIENLRIANAAAPGAVVVTNNQAKTILNNVSIDRATRYGIYQQGGTLIINNASIVYTSPGMIAVYDKENKRSVTISYGTGIFITNAVANLSNIKLRSNVQGLVADGINTSVEITNMLAERHTINTDMKNYFICNIINFNNGLAAIEARNGATMRIQGIKILDNEFCGLSVHDGAKLNGSDVIILRTKSVMCPDNKKSGGINASVRKGGAYLELTQFELGYGDLCGLQLINAKAKCSYGKVHHNPIGIHLKEQPSDFNFEDLVNNVIFQDNETNLNADILPVPPTSIPDFQ